MPRINIDLPQDHYDEICRVAQERKITQKAALMHILDERKWRENGAKMAQESRIPRERASSPSAQKENNNINTLTEAGGSDASRISSFSSLENNTENSKKAPPDFLPDDWEPPEEFQKSWCIKREYCYETALDIFKSKFKADPQRCADWDSKWRFFLLNGYLKGAKWSELEREEDYGSSCTFHWNPTIAARQAAKEKAVMEAQGD
jgi:hypothetical protein